MKSIYKTKEGKKKCLELYNRQLEKLGNPYEDIYVNTSFGKTHLVRTGNKVGKPLLVFHGGNSSSAYNLLLCKFLLDDFNIYAVDIIGHPGKSDEVSLSSRGYSYGEWASELIDKLEFKKMRCYGGSFGGGVLAKLMCVSPEKVERCVLEVPSGINNAFPISSAKMMIPLIKYIITKNEDFIIKTAMYMTNGEDIIDEDTRDILKDSFDNVKTKVAMPSNVDKKRMQNFKSPAFILAGEYDCLFPSRKVLKRAKEIISDVRLYELKGRGHMHLLTNKEKQMIIDFLK
ncbi:alpha/beta fold hydrolase [Anaerofustis stercorihominis]|uniref:alpha/beta fold hydrolase n=1 Tax=Anaerofustis stercorihominis TaxID=214853 RepID=UPI00214AA38D|nr:alpha/beta hydrolase [Anaerofustis stercorihominis]MCR2032772.1 alpha/beta hydrolase [Anaerofustis stercorihominis]